MNLTKIVIADDHAIVRKGLRTLIETHDEFSIVGEAADGLEAVRVTEQVQPDILLLDLMMPGLSGFEVLRRIRKAVPNTKVVVFSMHNVESYVLEALKSGATAFVLKNALDDEIIKALRETSAGRRYLSPPLSENAIDAYVGKLQDSIATPFQKLTPREFEVLRLAAQGLSNQEIGERLFISTRTAETHRSNLMKKLGLHSQVDILHFVDQHGIMVG
jgi:two-component system, NarL family, response regulator NreC